MEYRTLGKSEIQVSEIAFGAWAIGGWLWGGADAKDAIRAVETAIDHGMTTIDTAAVYGFGLSEELVAKAVKGKRDKAQILTKFGMIWDEKKGKFYFSTQDNNGKDIDIYAYSSKERVLADCDRSLKNLGTDYIDLYQIHWPDATTPVSETMEALELLISKGKIRAGAVSNYSHDLMAEALKTLQIASNQIPYSMVNREIEKEIVPYCIDNNIGILAYSPLQRGLLTGKFKKGHSFGDGDSRPDTPYYKEPNLSRIIDLTVKLKVIADERSVTLSQLALNWTKEQPGITCVLAGARNPEQVLDNVKAVDFKLTGEEMKKINDLLADLKLETRI
ncbi:MAG: aldo/keto reductase [Bacteroidetes bacterium GWE2_41_25]|nr:MAG: aldo/keto reductase [Bacteroidetes bacterium GWA2_40_15]OFX99561.1 MAG: aldo/keto reductase [Bacteroidetes bacterium GWC2_40_22]OFY11700.1 MAG: aldo/keto reductase [Bacteroidetes bacterium GWE2_41_25]HBH83206.1 aldo/keto reductase [Bacteroidales bacterium]HBQ83765.1 aldo/keto reductase [Bacteroidales bacterium]